MMETNNNSSTHEVKRSLHTDLAVKILCVLAAFCMWIYVMQVESPEHEQIFSHITVQIPDMDNLTKEGVSIYSGYGQMIDVTLAGKKSVLSKLTEDDIVATADFSGVEAVADRYHCRIIVDVPAGCKLVGLSQEYVSIYLDESDKVNVNLSENRGNTHLPDGCSTGLIQFSTEQITVSGPVKAVAKVAKAVVNIDLSGVTSTITKTYPVTLLDKYDQPINSPYLNYYPREVSVTVPVLKTVTVPVNVRFRYGFFDKENTEITLTPAYIDVTGDPAVIDAGGLIEDIEINEKTDFTDMQCIRTVALESVPGVTLSSSFTELAIQVDESYKTREITVPGENIKDTGGKTGVQYGWEKDPIVVTIMGPIDAISKISPEDITIKLDMSPYDGSNTGGIRVKAEIDIDSQYADEVIEVGSYIVLVTIYE